ncbi:MAG: penicillin-binding protein activator [Gammaproteobacteria bacterium]|nr:penicillin-binding protein activator [Gammaproteobacteria bacterium]
MLPLKKLFPAVVLAFSLAISGCTSMGLDTFGIGVNQARSDRAETLANKGDYAGAAYLYELLARSNKGKRRTEYLQRALTYYETAGDEASASRIRVALANEAVVTSNVTTGEIAVLLPSSGVYANAANAVRRGIEAVYTRQPEGKRPTLRYIDSSNLADAIGQADSAAMILGPLSKPSVQQVVSKGLNSTTITLNQVSNYSPKGVYQFGLSPVAEGEMIAEKAFADGHRTASIIYPDTSWGSRYEKGFRQRWYSLGGSVTARVIYPQGAGSFTNTVGSAMKTPADTVFIVAKPGKARKIRAQLLLAGDRNPAVYASSTAYDRRLYGLKDSNFENVWIPVLRWTVPGTTSASIPSYQELESGGAINPGLAKFYAFGIDAMLLALNAGDVSRGKVLKGATGDLSLDSNGIIRRNMLWLHYHNGALTQHQPGSKK